MNGLTRDKKHIFKTMLAVMLVALVASFVIKPVAYAQDEAKEEVASFRTMNTAKIKGSEKVPPISVEKFLRNIWENTGIYQIIHQKTDAEIAKEKADEAAALAAMEEDPFAEARDHVPGWQKIVMIAIGFLIVYLAVAKGFEPLLLIPIGFGTILVNIPGAGMGDAPHGMLHIIYSAGVGNEFFPMLIFMGIGAMTTITPIGATLGTDTIYFTAELSMGGNTLGGLAGLGFRF